MRKERKERITMAEYVKLDPYAEEYKKATLDDLIGDAVSRKDKKALEWLKTESGKKDDRTRNGKNIKVNRNIAKIRADYAKKYLGYKPKTSEASEKARKQKQEKAEQERLKKFEDAFAALGE